MDPFITYTYQSTINKKKPINEFIKLSEFVVILEYGDCIFYKNGDYENLYYKYDYGVVINEFIVDFVGYTTKDEFSRRQTNIHNNTHSIDVFSDLGVVNAYIKHNIHNDNTKLRSDISYTNCNFLCQGDTNNCLNYNNYLIEK